jgi:hypothetical protein
VTKLKISRTPWQRAAVEIFEAHAFGVEFTSLSHDRGARVLRRLDVDEEPDERDVLPPDTRLIPPRWSGLSAEDASVETADIAPGSITTPTIAANATSLAASAVAGAGFNTGSSTYQDVTGATVSPTISSSGSVIQAIAQGNIIVTNGAGTTADLVARFALRNGSGTVLREGSVTLDSRVSGANESIPFTLLYVTAGLSGAQTFKVSIACGANVSLVEMETNVTVCVIEFKR